MPGRRALPLRRPEGVVGLRRAGLTEPRRYGFFGRQAAPYTPGMLSGGIIGTLLDCHCNWTAAYHLMKQAGADHPPCTVTADYTIRLMRPTPTDQPVELRARVVESKEDRAIVEGELIAHDKVTATCRGTFVAVKPGHPAYHRW